MRSGHLWGSGKRLIVLLSLGMLFLTGCGTSPLKRVDPTTNLKRLNKNALISDTLSPYTKQVLRQYGLQEAYWERPSKTIYILAKRLHNAQIQDRPRDIAFALSELCYLHVRMHKLGGGMARTYLASSARYAYAVLFDKTLGPPLSDFDPRYRLAADFYNQSLAQVARLWGTHTRHRVRKEVRLVLGRAKLNIPPDLIKEAPILRKSKLAFDYEIKGFQRRVRFGLGVPLIVPVPQGNSTPSDEIIHQVSVKAASFFVYFTGSARDLTTVAKIAVYNPVKVTNLNIEGRKVPLQADLTAPIAYILERGEEFTGILGVLRLLRGTDIAGKRGLYLFEPYDPKKIPVVMIHGLMSSPLTWLKMFNELITDPVLSRIYQFWFFAYPTGNPILVSAQELRKALYTARRRFDPEGKDKAFDHMVLVSHSMGGLLAQLMISYSDGSLWPKLMEQKSPYLHSLVQFKPVPFVSRVIFMATPHKGAYMASQWTGRLGDRLISFPKYFLRKVAQSLQSLGLPVNAIPSGIDNLAPNSTFMQRLNKLRMANVPFHSIIGNKEKAGEPGGSDGIVPYWSSHFPGEQSELIVKSGHSVQNKMRTIEEVRRILLLHAKEAGFLKKGEVVEENP